MIIDVEHLMSAGEIERLLDVSRQRVYQLAATDDFPTPVATLKAGRVWATDDVLAWAESKGRDTHPW